MGASRAVRSGASHDDLRLSHDRNVPDDQPQADNQVSRINRGQCEVVSSMSTRRTKPAAAPTDGRSVQTGARVTRRRTRDPSGHDELPFPLPIGSILGLARLAEQALDGVGVSLAQYRVLGFCAMEPRTPSQVAIWLSVRRQSVTRQLDALVQSGFLERTVDPHDRRRLLHGITPAGHAVLEHGRAAVDDYLALVLATIDEPDRELVQAGLAAAGRALNRAWELVADADDIEGAAQRLA